MEKNNEKTCCGQPMKLTKFKGPPNVYYCVKCGNTLPIEQPKEYVDTNVDTELL